MTKREHQMLKEIHREVCGKEEASDLKWWQTLLFVGLCVVLLLLMCSIDPKCHASETMLISDYDFTNRVWNQTTVDTFMAGFPKTRLQNEDRIEVIRYAWDCRLNALTVLVCLETENSLITGDYPMSQHQARMDRAMGWGLGKKSRWGFRNQIEGGCQMLRRDFDAWRPGQRKRIHVGREDERWVTPENAATASRYVYLPFYSRFWNVGGPQRSKGFWCDGNQNFERVFREWKPKWEAVVR